MSDLPIGDYALLSDCRSAALVSRAGSVDWLCLPRFDGPAVFARLLDQAAGHFAIRPAGEVEAGRAYLDQTMALETTFRTGTGVAVLVDAMAVGRNDRGHQLGVGSPGALLRRITCTDGELEVEVGYAPRPEYGLIHPILEPVPGGLAARGGADRLLLSTPVTLRVDGATATGRFSLRAGEAVGFALQHGRTWEPALGAWSQEEIAARLADTLEGWRSWSRLHQAYEGPWRELVHHSGRVLQALTFAPTGAIVAAPTTSLPETVGGERNWDYRYSWVRDASLTMEALWVAACPDEANRFFAFLADAAASQLDRGADLQIMFGVGGERDLSERELVHLSGWRSSRPVRVGNGAWTQRQLDVYGELLGAAQRLVEQLGELDPVTRRFLVAAADTAARRWTEQDQGIWEVRGAPRDFVYSKLMCWVALDRAIGLAGQLDATDRIQGWTAAREEVRAAILERGWSDRAGAFTQAFDGDELDASSLMLACTGFLPGDDPRMKATIDAIATRLTDQRGLVWRYRAADGLEGQEGTFLLCTFWLAQAQALAGEVDAARATFERAVGYANDVGLLAEEVEVAGGELLGNFPQAFSHIGLVNAAWAITQAEQDAHRGEPAQPPGSTRAEARRPADGHVSWHPRPWQGEAGAADRQGDGAAMRAVVYDRYGPPEVLRLQDVEQPAPGRDEALVRIHATTVNRTDTGVRSGQPFASRFVTGLRRPGRKILGSELAGEVAAVGAAVTEFQVGDRVFGVNPWKFGAHAELICLPERAPLAPMPAGMTFEEAAAVCDGALLALGALRRAGLRSGQRILVYGASGSIGTAGVQLARSFDAHVTAVCNTSNLELVRSLGADQVVDYTREDFTRNGQTYDLIFDAVGKHSFRRCRGSLAPGGAYVATDGWLNIFLAAGTARIGDRRVVFDIPPRYRKQDVVFLKELIEAGRYRAVIDRCYPLEDVLEATRYVETGQKTGNVVLTVTGDRST